MIKIFATAASGLIGLGLAASAHQEPGGPGEPPPPHKKGEAAKKKADGGPAGDLRRAYGLIRKLRAEGDAPGRGDKTLADWSDQAADLYRRGVKAHEAGDHRLAHEYGAAAHDLARAVDHARNASLFSRPPGDLPPPPKAAGPEGGEAEIRRDLRHAHDRLVRLGEGDRDGRVYIDAARGLYNDALREAKGASHERARELAKAAEAMTHVPEHLGHAAKDEPEPRPGPEEPKPKPKPHEPGEKAEADDGFPPPLR